MPPFVVLEYNLFRSKMFHLDMSKLYISIKRLNPTSFDLWLFKPPKGYIYIGFLSSYIFLTHVD